MKWKFAQCDEQICVCMGMLIIISGEICQFIFPLYTEDVNTKLELLTCDVTSSWGEMKLFLFQVTKLAVLLYTLCTGLSLENMWQEMQICF